MLVLSNNVIYLFLDNHGVMEMLEVLPIAMFATAMAVLTWFVLYQYTDIQIFQSFYSALIFPIIFGFVMILFYKKYKR